MSAASVPETQPVPGVPSPLPEGGPRLLLVSPVPHPVADAQGDPMPELLRLATQAEALLADPTTSSLPVDTPDGGRRLAAVAALLRDAAAAVAAADAHVVAARVDAARIAAQADEEVVRLWRTVSADVTARRAATDAYVARARERAEREAETIVAEASARADTLLAKAEDLVAAWLDEANAELAGTVPSAPGVVDVPLLPVAEPTRRRRRRFVTWLFRRS